MRKIDKLELIIKGDPKSKKNGMRSFYNKGRTIVMPSKASVEYEKDGIEQIQKQIEDIEGFKTIDYPVNVKTVFYRKTKRNIDISNMFSAIHDILSRSGVIVDDSWKYIESVDGSKVRFDKNNPRTEIVITRVKGESAASLVEEEEKEKKRIKEERKRKREEDFKNRVIEAHKLNDKGLTNKEIGEKLKLSTSTISRYINNYNKKGLKK